MGLFLSPPITLPSPIASREERLRTQLEDGESPGTLRYLLLQTDCLLFIAVRAETMADGEEKERGIELGLKVDATLRYYLTTIPPTDMDCNSHLLRGGVLQAVGVVHMH